MKNRSKLLTLLSIAVVLVALLGLSACKKEHTHSYSEWKTVAEPTCAIFGIQKRTCECGYEETKTQEALQHTLVTDAAVDATCTSAGKTEGSHCDVCKTVTVPQDTIAPVAHSFSAWETLVAPTCTSLGIQKQTCECGYTEYQTTAALQHTPVTDAAINATCTTDGKTEGSHCNTCGTVLTAQNTIRALGHKCDNVTVLTEAECNAQGSKRFACSNDGCTYYYDEAYALDELNAVEIMEAAKKYVGCIKTYSHREMLIRDASAVVISSDGKILTVYSVLNDAAYVTFTLGEQTYVVNEILAYDQMLDLAVLKIDATDLTPATLCESKPVTGEKVYAIGNAMGLSFAINEGIVSNSNVDNNYAYFIQHSAVLMTGFGGGPLVNRFGEVIGINYGYYQEREFRLALPITQLSELKFDDPITIEENFNLTYTAQDRLIEWVMEFATTVSENVYYVEHKSSTFSFAFGYSENKNYLFIESIMLVEDGSTVLTIIPLVMSANGTYQYYVKYSNNVFTSEIAGYFDPTTYGDPGVPNSTKLTYDTFYGRYQSEEIIMNACSYSVYETLGWFSYWLDTYFFEDINLKDTFGFNALSFERDETALDKINSYVLANGTFDSKTGLYALTNSQTANDATYTYTVYYRPASNGVNSETVISLIWVSASGTLQEVSIVLNPRENGNLFTMTAATWNGTSFDIISQGWGYIDANSFTDTTPLTCYVFQGYEEYQDLLLGSAANVTKYLLNFTNKFMAFIEPGLSIRDLGFLFYFLP